MKSAIQLLICILLLFSVTCAINGQAQTTKRGNPAKASYVSLIGEALPISNPIEADGNIHRFNSPVLHLIRTKSGLSRGTILVLPGGGYERLNIKNEGESAAQFLNAQNFDVAILEYHIGTDLQTRDLALVNTMQAFRLLKATPKLLDLCGDRLDIMGISSGGHLAARAVQKLGEKEQPNDLILISPSYLNETLKGTVFPAVMPPVHPTARLFVTFSNNDNKAWISSCQEYTKTWKGYDGTVTFNLLNGSAFVAGKDNDRLNSKLELAGLLKTFLESKPEIAAPGPNPAAVPIAGGNSNRHAEKLALIAKEKFDLIMVGNSITNNFERPEYQPVWNQFFGPRKALNLGFSGYRTENIIWNIQNGELEGQSPKVIVLEIGTNNVDDIYHPTLHTASQLAGGIEAIVKLLREKCPSAKLIILKCFPGCYIGPNPTSRRAILDCASDMVSRLVDGIHVFYCDVNHVFLNLDGSINHELMPDWLHPSPAGAKAWAQAMEPLLSELMGDKSLDAEISANSAIVPVSKLENDFYNWWNRHSEVLRIKDSINPEIVLIGNSITHLWGGEPRLENADGKTRIPNGPKSWASIFENYRVLNLGFGWDRTQNVLWRLDHGELDGLHPRTVIINIGTNNTSKTENARMNTATEIVEGIREICGRVRSKVPQANIILMAVFPREQSPTNPRRILINEINRQLEAFTKANNINFVDIGPKMLAPDGTLSNEIASDFCHPTEKGYQIWADELKPIISKP